MQDFHHRSHCQAYERVKLSAMSSYLLPKCTCCWHIQNFLTSFGVLDYFFYHDMLLWKLTKIHNVLGKFCSILRPTSCYRYLAPTKVATFGHSCILIWQSCIPCVSLFLKTEVFDPSITYQLDIVNPEKGLIRYCSFFFV